MQISSITLIISLLIISLSLYLFSNPFFVYVQAQEGLNEFVDSFYPVKLQFPSDWSFEELHVPLGETDRVIQIANFFPPDNNYVYIKLFIDNHPVNGDLNYYVQDTISSYTKNLQDFQLQKSETFDKTYQITFTFLDDEQNVVQRAEYGFYNTDFVYYIELTSPIDQFDYYFENFQNIVSSISLDNFKTKSLPNTESTSESQTQDPSVPATINQNQQYQGKTTKLGVNLKSYENPYFGIMNLKLPVDWITSENKTTLKISPLDDKTAENAQIMLNSYYYDGRSLQDILKDYYNTNIGYITESRPVTINSKYNGHLFTLTSYYQGTNIPFDKRLVIFISPPPSPIPTTTSDNSYYYVIEYFSYAKTFEKYLSSAISIIKSIKFGNPVDSANIKGFIKSSPL